MDRKSNLKIKEILFTKVVFLIMIGFVFCHVDKKISENQIYEMTTIHPELENEIQNTFDYYDNQRQGVILGVIICIGILSSIIIVAERIYNNKRIREQSIAEQNSLQELQECIEAFQKEDYTTKQNMFSENVPFANNWLQIQDAIQRLGRYLSDLRVQLHQEENSTKTLITDISHQLKTPLASLKMCFELTQEATLNEMEKAEFIEKEKQEITKLESLLGELVKLSRLESNMIQVNPMELSIEDLITEAVNPVVTKANEKNVEIQVELLEKSVVYVDLKWTAEALVNVLDNAIKYSSEGSTVQVHVRKMPHIVLIEVEDEGIGIESEELHKIFQRFYRGKIASKKEKEGAGVGLYLARKIIEEQGGTITAKRKQVGTVFRITFPI